MKKIIPIMCFAFSPPLLFADSVDVTVRRAPYVVSTVSAKSEKDWAECRYCGRKTSYERTYKWDVYKHFWVETTKQDSIPDVCRRCKVKERGQDKLDREERDLDRQIELEKTKIRIDKKKEKLERLRREAR